MMLLLVASILISSIDICESSCDQRLTKIHNDLSELTSQVNELLQNATKLHYEEMKVRRVAAYYDCEAYFTHRRASASGGGYSDGDDSDGGGAGEIALNQTGFQATKTGFQQDPFFGDSGSEPYNSYNGTVMTGYCHKRSQNGARFWAPGGIFVFIATLLVTCFTSGCNY